MSQPAIDWMVAVLLTVLVFGGLVACSGPPAKSSAEDYWADYMPGIWTDPATGCQYMVRDGLNLRVRTDGTAWCDASKIKVTK